MNKLKDLNSIRYLEALLRLKSVSQAAKELGITQPALSNALTKLRDQLEDPLLVRKGQMLDRTLFAEQLSPELTQQLHELDSLFLKKEKFDPSIKESSFRFLASDYASLVVIPELMEHLKEKYSLVKLHVHKLAGHDLKEELQSLKYSFGLGTGERSLIPEGLFAKTLFQDRFAVAASVDHPRIKKRLTMKQYLKEEHIFVNPIGLGATGIDEALRAQGHERKVTTTLPHISVACQALKKGDSLLTLPRRALEVVTEGLPIKVYDLPFDYPHFDITLIWHERTHHHNSHKWMRTLLSEIDL